MWLKAPHTLSIQKVIKDLCNSPKVLGQHYFVDNPEKSKKDAPAIVPKFDFTSASQKGHAEECAKAAKSCELTISVFWIIKDICNLNRFTFQQNAANYSAASRFK